LEKPVSHRAWFLLLPMVAVLAVALVLPLVQLVNLAFHPGETESWAWAETARLAAVLTDPEIHAAYRDQLIFSVLVLAIELPLGVGLALLLPRTLALGGLAAILLALPLVMPAAAVAVLGHLLAGPLDAALAFAPAELRGWFLLLALDVWHWTPLFALLAHAGLLAVPERHRAAARIDGASAWRIFRVIELRRLRLPLTVAVMLRLADSLALAVEPDLLAAVARTPQLPSGLIAALAAAGETGRMAALGLVQGLVVLIVAFVFFRLLARQRGPS